MAEKIIYRESVDLNVPNEAGGGSGGVDIYEVKTEGDMNYIDGLEKLTTARCIILSYAPTTESPSFVYRLADISEDFNEVNGYEWNSLSNRYEYQSTIIN